MINIKPISIAVVDQSILRICTINERLEIFQTSKDVENDDFIWQEDIFNRPMSCNG